MSAGRRKKFGEILVDAGVITEQVLSEALERQKGTGKRLGQVLETMGVVTEKHIAVAVAQQFGFKTVKDIAKFNFPEEVLALIEKERAVKSLVFPLKKDGLALYLAMVNPLDMETIDHISFRTRLRVIPCVTTPTEIQEAINRHYFNQGITVSSVATARDEWWTILVIDDHELARGATVAALKRQGYHVLEATNGADGASMTMQTMPHLILTEINMPRMDGYEMYNTLQINAAAKDLPIIALTNKATPEEEAKLLGMGFFDFIPKPLVPVRLIARVKRALRIAYGETPPLR